MRKRPTYSATVKAEAFRLYVTEQLSAKAVAQKLGLKTFTVKEWLSAAGLIRSMSEAAALSVSRRSRGHRGIKAFYISAKTGVEHHADSQYEVLRMSQLDADPTVSTWRRCRDRIPYISPAGKARRYNPDFDLTLTDGSRVIEEVKPSRFAGTAEAVEKHKAASAFYALSGARFRLITEAELATGDADPIGTVIKRTTSEERRERHNRLVKQRRREREASETPDERRARLDRLAAKARRLRKTRLPETPEKRAERLRRQRLADAKNHANETDEHRRARLDKKAKSARDARAAARAIPSLPASCQGE